jgi:hypothetical protein
VSQNDRYAKIAASRLQRAWREGRARLSAAPRNSIAAAEQALRARRRRRILVAWTVPVLASSMAAAGLVLGWFSLAHRTPHAVVAVASDPRALMLFGTTGRGAAAPSPAGTGARPLGPGDQVFAPHTAPVSFGDAGGTQLTLEPGGSLTVVEASATRRFALRQGAVSARVRKLVAGERFIIETSDAEVEVHGTEFRVASGAPEAVPCSGPGPREMVSTRVTVYGGVVSVKWSGDEQRLLPGDEWPPRCARAPAAPLPAEVARASDPPPRASHRRTRGGAAARSAAASAAIASAGARPPAHEPPPSILEAQNDLYLSAVRARRMGRTMPALALFNRFIQEYPDATLFESALAQKMRLLAATGDPRGAAVVARQYLGRFPDGFARDEARTLLATGGS